MSSITGSNTSWHCLPGEIRNLILGFLLLQDGCNNLAGLATVSQEWQSMIEPHNFAQIKLTPSRFVDFNSIAYRHRIHVRCIWFCLELQEYDCPECTPKVFEGLSNADNIRVTTAFQRLFSSLSAWEPNGTLRLDISVLSPSDSKHWFRDLTFGP
jgi:hypothetical protein